MTRQEVLNHLIRGIVVALCVLVPLGASACYQFGSLANLGLYLGGHDFAVRPTVADVGAGLRGEKRTVFVHVRNLAFRTIRVVGMDTTCNCLAVDGLPVEIEPRQAIDLELSVYLESSSGDIKQIATLMFDNAGKLHEVPVVITGKCLSAQTPGPT